jgi:hypothetical protein
MHFPLELYWDSAEIIRHINITSSLSNELINGFHHKIGTLERNKHANRHISTHMSVGFLLQHQDIAHGNGENNPPS